MRRHQQRRPTLRDVSAAAGVSVYTASRALSGHAGVASATRQLVVEAARALSYVPNENARSLKEQKSRAIGILTANSPNLFYHTLVNEIERVVAAEGYHTFVSDVTDDGVYDEAREAALIRTMFERRVAAATFTYTPKASIADQVAAWGIPMMFADCLPPEGHEQYASVVGDGESGGRAVGDHFAVHGYDTWAFVGYTRTWSSRILRERGFRSSALAHGAGVDVVEGGNSVASSHAAFTGYLASRKRPPSAVFAGNEPLAIGTMLALRDLGLSVPDDVAIIGYDDFPWAPLTRPALTIVDQGVEELGRRAGRHLLEAISQDGQRQQAGAVSAVVPIRGLRVRESCGCAPNTQ